MVAGRKRGMRIQDRYLFKAKRIKDAQWIEGYLIYSFTGVPFIITEYDHILALVARDEIDPETICQCTGLKDKNGNLIWENDIVKKEFYTDYDAYANSEKYIGVMRYEDGGWWVKTQMDVGQILVRSIIDVLAFSKDVEHFEVLGNVVDNPELLEV